MSLGHLDTDFPRAHRAPSTDLTPGLLSSTLRVSSTGPPYGYHPSTVTSTVAAALPLLSQLHTLSYDFAILPVELQRAIVSHPTLRTLIFGSPHFASGNLNLEEVDNFPRDREHPLVVTCIEYPYAEHPHVVDPNVFFARLRRYNIHVQALTLQSGSQLNLEAARLLPTIADFGLTSLALTLSPYNYYEDEDDHCLSTILAHDIDWIAKVLAAHPSLVELCFLADDYQGEDHPVQVLIPWRNLAAVDGLDRVVSPALETWSALASAEELKIQLKRGQVTDIVGFSMRGIHVEGGGTIPAEALADLAIFLPNLESLTLTNFYHIEHYKYEITCRIPPGEEVSVLPCHG